MKPRTPGFWLIVATVGLLALLPMQAYAGMTPEEVKVFEAIKVNADKGNAQAQSKLGECYYRGQGVAQDYVQAVSWFRKAADQGDANGQGWVGTCYRYGDGVAKDEAKGVSWYRKSAEQGDANAQFMLGICYDNGAGVSKDTIQAFYWWRKAAEMGNASAQFSLGVYYASGIVVAKDQVEAYAYWDLSGITDEGARNNLARLKTIMSPEYISRGQQRTKELQKEIAAKKAGKAWSEVSAQATALFNENKAKALQGDILGQYRLGISFSEGLGVEKDPVQAAQWKKKADAQVDNLKKKAADGDATSQFALGFCHAQGMGVAKDKNLAYTWYRKAADQEDVLGQFYLAWCYSEGEGVPKDLLQSLSWFRKAAEQGHIDAQKSLAGMYKFGDENVPKDEAQAFLWYHEAATQGDGQSCLIVAMCYMNGTGMAVDNVEAYAYVLLAAQDRIFAHDYKPLAKVMSIMESSVTTAEQRARGLKRSVQLREEFAVKIAAKKAETSKKVGK